MILSEFVLLTNRFPALVVWREKKGVGGRENLPGNIKCSSSVMRTCGEAGCLKTIPSRVWCVFGPLNSSVTAAQIENEAKTPSQFFSPLSYWNIFTEYEGRKHLDLSQWVQSGSLFRIFSTFHTHGALWVMLKRSCVQDVDGFLIWNSFPSLTVWHIWYVNSRLVKTFQSFAILSVRKDLFFKKVTYKNTLCFIL